MANLVFNKIKKLIESDDPWADYRAKQKAETDEGNAALTIAKDASQPHDTLMDLYNKFDGNTYHPMKNQIHSEIAKNGNVDVLRFMNKEHMSEKDQEYEIAEHPKEVSENPSLPLRDLEDPGWLENFNAPSTIGDYFIHDPEAWSRRVFSANNNRLKEAIVGHDHFPKEYIDKIIDHISVNPDHYDLEDQEDWQHKQVPEYIKHMISTNKNMNEKHLDKALQHPLSAVSDIVADRRDWPKGYLEKRFNTLTDSQKTKLSYNPYLPKSIADHFLKYGEIHHQKNVINNFYDKIDNNNIDDLFNTGDSDVIDNLMQNHSDNGKKLPVYFYQKALEHPRFEQSIATNHDLPAEVLPQIINHPNLMVRLRFAQHSSFENPEDHHRILPLVNDPDKDVRRYATERIRDLDSKTKRSIIKHGDLKHVKIFAQHPELAYSDKYEPDSAPFVQDALLKHSDPEIRQLAKEQRAKAILGK